MIIRKNSDRFSSHCASIRKILFSFPPNKFLLLFPLLAVLQSCGDQNPPERSGIAEEKKSNINLDSTKNHKRKTAVALADEKETNSSSASQFYRSITLRLAPSLKKLQLINKGTMSFPESMAEDMEGGGNVPQLFELHNYNTTIGLILYQPAQPYPRTMALVLPSNKDSFNHPIVHYEIISVKHHAVLSVMKSISGLLTEGPFEQSFFAISGFGQGANPLYTKKSEAPLTEKEEQQLLSALLEQQVPMASFKRACPEGVTVKQPPNLQLDFNRKGILNKTRYTGFTTDFFYYFTSPSSLAALPLSKYMISPDDKRIESAISKEIQKSNWQLKKIHGTNVLTLKASSPLLPSGKFCQ